MKRRHFLIALAVIVPLAIFVAAKTAASWRPVAVTRAVIDPQNFPTSTAATARFALMSSAWGKSTLFDLKAKSSRLCDREGITLDSSALWQLGRNKSEQQLVIRCDGAAPRSYKIPAPAFAATFMTRSNGIYMPPQVTIHEGRVNLLVGQWFCRWDAASGQLERARTCDIDGTFDENALALNGETVINTQLKSNANGLREVSAVSTRTGLRTPRFTLDRPLHYELKLSPLGTYAIYQPNNASAPTSWEIFKAETGRHLWNLPLDQMMGTVAFSPDETLVAVERTTRRIWEIRDARTGEILRTLPLRDDTYSAAFSPDGATLYSVANGVLYQQRAR